MRVTERLFQALIERSHEAVALLAADGTTRYVSPAGTRLVGYTPEEVAGGDAFVHLHPADRERCRGGFARLAQTPGASDTAEVRYQHKDGSWRWLDVIATNLLDDASVQAIVANYRDIT